MFRKLSRQPCTQVCFRKESCLSADVSRLVSDIEMCQFTLDVRDRDGDQRRVMLLPRYKPCERKAREDPESLCLDRDDNATLGPVRAMQQQAHFDIQAQSFIIVLLSIDAPFARPWKPKHMTSWMLSCSQHNVQAAIANISSFARSAVSGWHCTAFGGYFSRLSNRTLLSFDGVHVSDHVNTSDNNKSSALRNGGVPSLAVSR